MSDILGIFNIGRLAILAEQRALGVTSQNIANVNTPGYSRQEAVFQAAHAVDGQPGQIGTGVRIKEIRRQVDQFVENRLTLEQSNLGRYEVDAQVMRRIETVFQDIQGVGIDRALSDLFAAMQDLANHPQGSPERTVLLERAAALAQKFASSDARLDEIRADVNREIEGRIETVNQLAAQIAALNADISRAELVGQNANDLRDERGRRLNELAGFLDLNHFEDPLGQLTVLVSGGKPLVEANRAFTLRAVADPDNGGFFDIVHDPGSGSTTEITGAISNGRLRGLVDLRDNVLPDYIDRLDRLAAGIVNEFNQQHRLGFGLDGSTGSDFFSPLSPAVLGLSANTGSAAVGASVAVPTGLTFDPYELVFSAGNYTVQNLTTGASTSGAYVDPTTITFEGIQISMSGAPANGDTFRLSAHQGTAGGISVAVTDPDAIAAAGALAGLPGDNANALLLGDLQEKGITALGGTTFEGFYGSVVGAVGSRTQAATRGLSVEEVILNQVKGLREETSGVSLDEEMTHLIRFQRSFEAAARLITVADELLQTLLAMKR